MKIERLEELRQLADDAYVVPSGTLLEAIQEIDRLRAAVAQLLSEVEGCGMFSAGIARVRFLLGR